MKKHLLHTRHSINIKTGQNKSPIEPLSFVLCLLAISSALACVPHPWAGGVVCGLVSLPGVPLSKLSSVPWGQGVLHPSGHLAPINITLFVFFSMLRMVSSPSSVGFTADFPQVAPSFLFRTFLSDLIHNNWVAFCPLSSKPNGFLPAPLASPSLPQLPFSSASDLLSMNLSQPRWPKVVSLPWCLPGYLTTPVALSDIGVFPHLDLELLEGLS